MKVLIVDDDKDNLYLLETVLKGQGYRVSSATNGAEALERLRAEEFDMIISDILMPVLDGFQLCRICKTDKKLKKIPFVFYTATYVNQKDEELALALGADRFIRKPIEVDEFINIIQGVLKEARKGKLISRAPTVTGEEEVFKLYSERLVKKLEKKMLDLEKEIARRKRAEKALQEVEERYRALFDRSSYCLYMHDFQGNFLDANAAALKLTGYDREEISRLNFASLLSEDQLPQVFAVLQELKETGRQKHMTSYKLRCKDGSLVDVETVATVVYREGQPYAIQGVAIDVSERKKAEEQILHLNRVLNAIRKINQLIAKGTDRDTLLKGVCQAFVEARGYYNVWITLLDESGKLITSAEVGLGEHFHPVLEKLRKGELVHCVRHVLGRHGVLVVEDVSVECVGCPVASKHVGRSGMSVRLEHGGKVYGVIIASVPTGIIVQKEEKELFAEIAADVAFALYSLEQEQRRKEAEEAIRRSEEYFKALVESSSDVVAVLDSHGILRYLSPNYEAIWGRSRTSEIGKEMFSQVHPDDVALIREKFDYLLKNPEAIVNLEIRRQALDGSWRNIEVVGRNLLDNPAVRGLVATYRDITNRKRVEEALQKSEEHYRTLTENAGEVILVVQDNVIKYINPKGAELSGYSREELISKPFVQFIHPDDANMVFERYSKRLKGEPVPQTYEFRITRKDGAIRCGELNAVPILWEERPAVLCFISDITERKEAEKALRQSEERYRTILEDMEEGYYEVDRAGTFTFVNNAMCRMLGYSQDELIGMNYKVYTRPEDVKAVFTAYNRVYRTGEPLKWFPMVSIRKDGTRIFVEDSVFPLRNEKGEVIGFRGISRDVTERKKVEEALRQSEEKYRTILEEMEDGYFETDLRGNVTFVNDAACRALGYAKEELVGMNYKSFVAEEDIESVFQVFNEVYRTGIPNRSFSWEVVRKDGVRGFVESWISPQRNAAGEIVGFRGVGRDITERRKMQEQLMLADRLASVGQLAAGIAHEINNPLTSVVGFSDMLLQKDLPADVKEDLEIVAREARRIVDIVKGLLAFARQQQAEKVHLNVNSIIQEVLQLRAYEQKVNNIQVDSRLAPDLPLVMGSATQLQQVFLNIIVNAEQAMTEAHRRGRLTVVSEQVGDMVRVSITDDGPGISPANMKKLFTPFFTTKKLGEGTGLGLSICHGIVSEHGGRIYAESKLGEGATFVVELPVALE